MRRLSLCLSIVVLLLTAAPASVADAADTKALALAAKLKKTKLSKVHFEDHKLEDVVKWLRVATGVNYHIKKATLLKADIDVEDITFTATLEKVSVAQVLELLLDQHELAVKIKRNVVYITTKKDAMGKPLTRMYGISHLTWTKTDFIAPTITLNPSDDVIGEYEPEVEVEDDPLNSGDAVMELIKEILVPEQWEENDDWSISGTDKYIVVKAPKSVQQRIPRILDMIASMK